MQNYSCSQITVFRHKKSIKIISSFILLLMLVTSSFAQVEIKDAIKHDPDKLMATGQAEIIDGNSVAARDFAIDGAMRKIVELSVDNLVTSDTITDNYQLLLDNIYSKSNVYIKRFNILEEKSAEGKYFVTIDALVSHENIKNDLISVGILSQKKNLPHFIMFVAQQNIDSEEYKFWWGMTADYDPKFEIVEKEMTKRFMEKGMSPVEKDLVITRLNESEQYNKLSIDPLDLATLTKQTGAEIIISGKALARVMGTIEGSSMKSILGNVSAKAMEISGNTIVSESASAKVLHVDESIGQDEALKKAAVLLADKMIAKIAEKWGIDEEQEMITVDINVSGLTYKRLNILMKILQNDIRGVTGVVQRSFTSGGKAHLKVDVKAQASFLANELKTRDFSDIEIEVTSYTPKSIDISLK